MQSVRAPSARGDVPVDLEGLGKEYGHFTALKSLDLMVQRGPSLAIVLFRRRELST